MFILDESGCHDFEDPQFGFVPSRGTNMAKSVTTNVISYCVIKGSPVCTCSLDAEGAFDAIPHGIIFKTSTDIIPDVHVCWRVLYYWYTHLT